MQSRLTSPSACWEDKITFYANSFILIQIYSCVCLELVRTDLWPWWWTGIEEFVFVYTHVIVTDRAAATSRLCSISHSVLNCLETEAKQFDHSPCILDIWNKERDRKRKMESKYNRLKKTLHPNMKIMLSYCFKPVTLFILWNIKLDFLQTFSGTIKLQKHL